MAKQTGHHKLQGTVGDVTYYETKDGFFAREKRTPKKVTNSRIKENMQEFARAMRGAKLIRTTFATFIDEIKDFYFTRRLASEMNKVIKADRLNLRGFRNISDGDIELIQGFEVNTDMALTTAFKAKIVPSIDRATGIMKVDFPDQVTASLISKPEGASHFRLRIGGASINFDTSEHLFTQTAGAYIPLTNLGISVPSLEVQLPAAIADPLILALGVSFYQEVNGAYYLVGDTFSNAVAFVAISGS